MPRTLASKVAAGSAIAGPTSVWAARWKTTSNSPASSVAPTRVGVAEVGLDQLDLGRDPLQDQAGERRRRQVEHGDRVAALEQRPRQVRGDEAVAAGDQRPLHRRLDPAASQTRHGASPPAQRSFSVTASL